MKEASAADMRDLYPIKKWDSPANGVWKSEIGNMTGELRHTDLAAETPRIESINKLSQPEFPFEKGKITYLITNDHKIMVRVPTSENEKLCGFGLQFDGLKQSGKVLTLNMDHWGRGGGRTHAPVPFYISSKGYGVFFNTARFLKVYNQIGNRKDSPNSPSPIDRNPPNDEKQPGPWQALPAGDAVEGQISANGMELIVFGGDSMLDVVCRYNLYCGGGAMPPLWGLGFWHRAHAHFTADETEEEVAQFKERDFPLDVMGLEPGWMSKSYPCTFEWQKKRFPDPAAFARKLLDDGIRLNLWVNPYISPESRIYEEMYPYSGSHMVWLGIVPDYNLPEARKILADQHYEDHFKIGISGYKVDEVDGYDDWLWPDHATFPSGFSGETMRQSYGLLMQNLLYTELFKKNDQRTYGNVRASNGAASGYPFVIYSDSYDHAEYITGISAASLCGILWTSEARSAGSDREWLNRMQTVCFSPMAKLNAWASGKKPWSYPSVTEAVRQTIQLRMRLLPYLYSAFAEYHFKGTPPMRAMVLEPGFDGDEEQVIKGKLDSEKNPYATDKVVETTDQFMFGPSIMVAPFYGEQAIQRDVHLPPGNWYDFYTGKPVGSGQTITVTSDELGDRIPLFVKEGAVIPMLAEVINNTEDAYGKNLEVRIYGRTDSSYDLYEDDGKSFAYSKGKFRIRRLVVKNGKLTEIIVRNNAPAMFGKAKLVTFLPDPQETRKSEQKNPPDEK
jgi:alpha-glucosidase (family GH31 glycosyl hydrolase)